jgi:uncharacterized membrane protein YfcA
MTTFLYCTFVIILGFGGEALFGFGGGLVAVPLLSLVLDVKDSVMLVSIFQFFVGFLILKNYKEVAWSLIPPLMLGMLFGVIVGVYSLSYFQLTTLRYVLSVYILLYLTKTHFFASIAVPKASYPAGMIAGFFGGFFQGALSTGGPNLVIYLKKLVPESRKFRATMIFWLSIANLARIPFSYGQDLYNDQVLNLAKFIFPAFLLVSFLGQYFHHKISDRLYFMVVHCFLLFAAIALIAKNLFIG